MDNQQATPTEAEIAWLAGILEGEGSLTLAPQPTGPKGSGYLKIAFHVMIYNTDGGIIRKVVEIMGRLGIDPHIKERAQKPLQMEGRPGYLNRDTMFIVRIRTLDDIVKFLTPLRPWLFGDKGARADLILQFVSKRINKIRGTYRKGPTTPYDAEDWQTVKQFLELGGRSTKMPVVERVLNEHEQRARREPRFALNA